MQNDKLTKSFIMEAYDLFMKSAKAINEIIGSVCDSVKGTINKVVGTTVIFDGKAFVLDGHDCVVSTFGNFIDLYFVRPRRDWHGWQPDGDLSPEDQNEDKRLVREYLKGGIEASVLYTSLLTDVSDLMFRIRLEPTMEEIADIYENDRFAIMDNDDSLNIAYGACGLLRVPKG